MNNMQIRYYENGAIRHLAESMSNGENHGIVVDWRENGKIWQHAHWEHGRRHGVQRIWNQEGEYYDSFWFHGKHITSKIKSIVKNLDNITPAEKTAIILHFGINL
jgi:antitoxin component YwqK of YwqJK toxin-antitoxin module